MNKLWFEIGFFGETPRWFGVDLVEGDTGWEQITIARIQIGRWTIAFGLEEEWR